jgi:hypothetical protein
MFGDNGQFPDFGLFGFQDIESWLQTPLEISGVESSIGGF